MTRGREMGREVSLLASTMSDVVGCATCGIGLAIEMVGQRWGEPSYDWGLRRDGHDVICPVSRNGLTEQQQRAVQAASDAFYRVQPALLPAPDSRLPPERDEDLQ